MEPYIIVTPLGKIEVVCEAIELHEGALVVLDDQQPVPQVILALPERVWAMFKRKSTSVSWSRGF